MRAKARNVRISRIKPLAGDVEQFIAAQKQLDFTYAAVGSTNEMLATSPNVDFVQVRLGDGAAAFEAARAALERWDHFRLGWVEPCEPLAPIQAGEIAAIAIRAMGAWWLNAARIVYVVDEGGPVSRFGYAYGTLPGHAESGEERFLVEWDHATDEVTYSVLAFSRPRHWLARFGRPLVRRFQHRFRRDSASTMKRAVRDALARMG
ncbi:MAG TPA: DUF1990 domain-containing protein [Lacipirellula sp.]